MTAMVGEFPELQGVMGRYYAEAEGYPEEVARAIEEHYRPRFAGDALPSTKTGQALALADKIDTLVGIFAIEQRPTGAKDPFGLRRAALGVLRILLECRLDLDLYRLLERIRRSAAGAETRRCAGGVTISSPSGCAACSPSGRTARPPEMIDAVLATRPRSPLDADARLQALKEFMSCRRPGAHRDQQAHREHPAQGAAAGGCPGRGGLIDGGCRAAPARCARRAAAWRGRGGGGAPLRRESRGAHRALVAPVDDFFERIMVMDEDPERRDNRLALLRDVQRLWATWPICRACRARLDAAVRSLLFTTYSHVLGLLPGASLMALCFLLPYRAQFAMARGWARCVLWVLERICGLKYSGGGTRAHSGRQSHRHEQAHLRLGDRRAVRDLPAPGVGAEARALVDPLHRLGTEAAAARSPSIAAPATAR